MTDTRKDKRAPISLKVRFKSATVDEFIEQYSKDISKGGIFIKSNKNSPPMPIGTLLKFEFQLKDESKLIQGVGRVVWKRELEGSSENDPAGMGIKFIKMDPESKGLVDQIVAGRGEAPGQFETGGGAVVKEDGEPGTASAASTTSSAEGKRPVRSQKATMQFFPSTTPQNELPKPEDRTQVRHASEFLASALSSAGVDEATTGEAEMKAEEARQRTDEIEKQREEQQKKSREDEDKKARAEKERQEREKAEAEEKAAAAKEKEASDKSKAAAAATAAADVPAKKTGAGAASDRPAAKKTSDRPPAKDEKKPAAAATPAKKSEPKAAVAAPPPAPADGGSNMMPIFAGVLVAVALGGWYMFGRGPDTTDTDLPPPSTTVEAPPTDVPPTTVDEGTDTPPTTDVEAPPTTDVEAPPTTDVEAPPTTTVAVPDAPMHDVRVDSTPSAATIVVDGTERGTAPQTLSLAEGDHTIEARLPGYRAATQTVHSAAGARPVRMSLTALPYIIHVTTTPPGARVRVGGRTVTAPGDATVPRPTAPLTATATLSGYVDATQRVEVSSFSQGADAMSTDLAITLTPRPAAPPPTTRVRPPPTTATVSHPPPETGTEPPPSTTTEHHETAPPPSTTTEHHETAPPPSTTTEHHETAPPPATEAPPDNPF